MAGSGEEPLNRELYRVPGHAGWFSWGGIHALEREALVEFFEGKTLSKTPKIYKEYRDFIISKYRENPRRRLTFTEVRKMLVGDVNCLRRVFEFLELWGLINHQPDPSDAAAAASAGSAASIPAAAPQGVQIVSKSFASTPAANLGSRENVFQSKGGKSQADGVSSSEWTPEETMLLLEAISKYGDNWNRVQQQVGSKSRAQCVKHFIQLPFGDQFLNEEAGGGTGGGGVALTPSSSSPRTMENGTAASHDSKHPAKKQKLSHSDAKDGGKASKAAVAAAAANAGHQPSSLTPEAHHLLEETGITPLSDASNPLLSQIAFMSAMVGPRVAAAAAQAALAVLAQEEPAVSQLTFLNSQPQQLQQQQHQTQHQQQHQTQQQQQEKQQQPQQQEKQEDMPMDVENTETAATTEDVKPPQQASEEQGEALQEPKPTVEQTKEPVNDQAKEQTKEHARISAAKLRAGLATALAAAAVNAKQLADQEEREMELLMANMIENQLKKLYRKLEHFEELEQLMDIERLQLEQMREQVFVDRLQLMKQHTSVAQSAATTQDKTS